MTKEKSQTKRRLNHRFRFHLLHQWLVERYRPCRAADIGGGKGLLAYLLSQSGWEATVIDPITSPLPSTFKDLTGNRARLKKEERLYPKRIKKSFNEEMANGFDLLIGLHAHGSNLKIINACQKYDRDFLLLPCCVIDEPIVPQPNIDWLESLVEYAEKLGFEVKRDHLNFKGQNVLLYSDRLLNRVQ